MEKLLVLLKFIHSATATLLKQLETVTTLERQFSFDAQKNGSRAVSSFNNNFHLRVREF